MSLTDHGPCWPDPDPLCCSAWASGDPALKERAAAIAAAVLHRLSGGRFGVCEVSVRPCGQQCAETTYQSAGSGLPWSPYLAPGGVWVNCGGCGCGDGCSCCQVCSVTLPGVVQEVVQVLVDGVVVAPSAYRVDRHRELVRTDGLCWPRCPNLSAPADEVGGGAFVVTYRRGLPLDAAGMWAYSAYACELLLSCQPASAGGDCCRLPERVQTITRQGVTMAMLDPLDFLDKGRVGVPEVDAWLAAVNPDGLRARPRVLSPDLPTVRRTTWP